jgi:phage terminase Nu1 subunit (DNA packaging protein)
MERTGVVGGYPTEQYGTWMRQRWLDDAGIAEDGKAYDLNVERARLAHHQANNEAIKEQVTRGELLPVDLVVALTSSLVAAARSRLLGIASKVRGRFPDLDKEVADEVDALVRQALTELGSNGLHPDLERRCRKGGVGVVAAAESDD